MAKRKKRRAKRFKGFGAATACAISAPNKKFMKWLAKDRNGHLDHEFMRVARQEARKRGYMPAKGVKVVAGAIKKQILKAKLVCKVPWIKKSDRLCKELGLFQNPDYDKVAACYLSRINWGFKEK